MIQQNKNEFDIESLPLPCLCPAFAGRQAAGRQGGGRQAGREAAGRQGGGRQAGSTFYEEAICCKTELKIASPDKKRRDRNDAKMI